MAETTRQVPVDRVHEVPVEQLVERVVEQVVEVPTDRVIHQDLVAEKEVMPSSSAQDVVAHASRSRWSDLVPYAVEKIVARCLWWLRTSLLRKLRLW